MSSRTKQMYYCPERKEYFEVSNQFSTSCRGCLQPLQFHPTRTHQVLGESTIDREVVEHHSFSGNCPQCREVRLEMSKLNSKVYELEKKYHNVHPKDFVEQLLRNDYSEETYDLIIAVAKYKKSF